MKINRAIIKRIIILVIKNLVKDVKNLEKEKIVTTKIATTTIIVNYDLLLLKHAKIVDIVIKTKHTTIVTS